VVAIEQYTSEYNKYRQQVVPARKRDQENCDQWNCNTVPINQDFTRRFSVYSEIKKPPHPKMLTRIHRKNRLTSNPWKGAYESDKDHSNRPNIRRKKPKTRLNRCKLIFIIQILSSSQRTMNTMQIIDIKFLQHSENYCMHALMYL